jgi:lactate permease
MRTKQALTSFSTSAKTLIPTALTLATAVPLVRIFINSNVDGAVLGSMPKELAATMAELFGQAWPMAASFVDLSFRSPFSN